MSTPPLFPIRTGLQRARWSWVGMLSGPWAAMLYFELLSTTAITFKLHEFVSVPLGITLITSLNLVFNILVGATCNYASDRVWTPYGRRKPFLVVGWITVAIGCLLLPQIDTFWPIVLALFFYEMLRDLTSPYESLCSEIVPPKQRGRSTATMTFARQAVTAIFFGVLIGQWDNTYTLPGGIAITGQQSIFWIASVLALLSAVFVGYFIHETPPKVIPEAPPRVTLNFIALTVREFLSNVFGDSQWRTLYIVALAQMIFWVGFGSLAPLLFTEQWGFSKQDFGYVIAIGTPFTLFVFLPLGGWIADRIDRLLLFKLLAGAITLNHTVFFMYLKLVAGSAEPPMFMVIVFTLIGTGLGCVGVVCTVSMMLDFVPRDRLGTVLSGIGITRGIASIFVNNGIGLWVTGVSTLTVQPAADGTIDYDYESGYLYLAFCGLFATAVAVWFTRQVKSGRIVPHGAIEAEAKNPET